MYRQPGVWDADQEQTASDLNFKNDQSYKLISKES